MIMCGEDFAYRNMTLNLAVFDILKYLTKSVSEYVVKISTLSEYHDAIFAGNYEFPVFGGDFFPYLTYDAEYMYSWVGYYTTRPYLKYRIAQTQKLVRAAEIVQSLVNQKSFTGYQNDVSTHHDAFTGTCRHEVFVDYIKRLDQDYVKCLNAISESFFSLPSPSKSSTALMIPYKIMILFNPINKNVKKLMNFASQTEYISIKDSKGNYILSQSVPYNHSFEIYFEVQIDSLGFKVLFVNEFLSDNDFCSIPSSFSLKNLINNGKIGVKFNKGLISTIFNKEQAHEFDTRIMGYNTSKAGAYILFPNVRFM